MRVINKSFFRFIFNSEFLTEFLNENSKNVENARSLNYTIKRRENKVKGQNFLKIRKKCADL